MTNYTKKRDRQNGKQRQGIPMMSDHEMSMMRKQFDREAKIIDKAIKDGLLPTIDFKRAEE